MHLKTKSSSYEKIKTKKLSLNLAIGKYTLFFRRV